MYICSSCVVEGTFLCFECLRLFFYYCYYCRCCPVQCFFIVQLVDLWYMVGNLFKFSVFCCACTLFTYPQFLLFLVPVQRNSIKTSQLLPTTLFCIVFSPSALQLVPLLLLFFSSKCTKIRKKRNMNQIVCCSFFVLI